MRRFTSSAGGGAGELSDCARADPRLLRGHGDSVDGDRIFIDTLVMEEGMNSAMKAALEILRKLKARDDAPTDDDTKWDFETAEQVAKAIEELEAHG